MVNSVVKLNRLIERLCDAHVDFVIVGGFAGMLHGSSLGSIQGIGDFAQVRAASIEIELFGRRCRLMSLQDLIEAKESLGRAKDLLAAQELRAIAEKQK